MENDKRMPFFSVICAWTNVYAFSPERNWGGSYGHNFQSVSEEELVWWFGVLIRDGARGSTGGAIHRRWMMNDVDHDDCIMNSMLYSRWIKIKSVLKLNHNEMTPKQGDPNYNPCAKYDYIFKTTIHNMNNIMEKTSNNGCINETTWAFPGYGGPCCNRIMGKPGINKGGQTVMLYDVGQHYP